MFGENSLSNNLKHWIKYDLWELQQIPVIRRSSTAIFFLKVRISSMKDITGYLFHHVIGLCGVNMT